LGRKLADSVQLRLRRQLKQLKGGSFYVLSWLELSSSLGDEAGKLADGLGGTADQIRERLGLRRTQKLYMVCGSADRTRAKVEFFEGKNKLWSKEFVSSGERAQIIISKEIVDAIPASIGEGRSEVKKEPDVKWGRSLVVNGDFEKGGRFPAGWDKVDGLCSFWKGSREDRYIVFDTHVLQDQASEWWKELEVGADPRDAPEPVRTDPPHYDSVGGIYGVSLYSDWIEVDVPCRLNLEAEVSGPRGGNAKIFVKGYDLLPKAGEEEKVRREVWRTYLNCRPTKPGGRKVGMKFDVPGKLGRLSWINKEGKREFYEREVKWVRLMLYAYWPVGEYTFDDVKLEPALKVLDKRKRVD
jgi:hypothetical protein